MSDYTPTTDEVRDNYSVGWAGWDTTLHFNAEAYAEFDRWLAAHDREVAARALRETADKIAAYYPETFFRPITPEQNAEINKILTKHGFTRDAISADVMRRAMDSVRREANEINNPYREEQ